ncbi:hypothetical protein LCGC14_1473980 [marine sediment metagenome]|uniref:Uncharacterized protein n=1 Tax=marine sediment metagenome TaxID=412755 RepID=A0A0F9JXG4_9ZZZZ
MRHPLNSLIGIWSCTFIAAGLTPQEVSAKVKNGLMTSQIGVLRYDGGKVDDLWTDFRFLQDGQTPLWEINEHGRWWVLILSGPKEHDMVDMKNMGRARITIMPSTHFRELAVDAGLEFLDRLRERRVPKFIDTPDALMALCAKAAIRQR